MTITLDSMIEQNIPVKNDTNAIWLIFCGDKVLQKVKGSELITSTWGELEFAHEYKDQIVKVGMHADIPCFLIDMGHETIEHQDYALTSLRALLFEINDIFFEIASRAWQVALFIRTHRFCGQCGTSMQQIDWEMAFQCPRCQHRCYPRISPCIIVSIRHNDTILLAQGKPQRQRNIYSTLAGFVESGETLEHAVHREVFEEVGIKVKNLRYFSSQPWPFPHSLMMGFLADYDSGHIKVDGKEILEAKWFKHNELPNIPPVFSISGQLIQHTLKEMEHGSSLPISNTR